MKKWLLLISLTFVLGVSAQAQVRLWAVGATNNFITIKNFGATAVDVSGYMVCANLVYFDIGSLTIINGNTTLGPGALLVFTGLTLTDAGGELGMYQAGTVDYADPSNMLDYVQWKTSGNTRESVADAAGLWTIGDFVPGDGPYSYTGDGNQNGVTFWGILGIEEGQLSSKIDLYPTLVTDQTKLYIESEVLTSGDDVAFEMFDMNGKRAYVQRNIKETEVVVLCGALSAGTYIYTVSVDNSVQRTGKLVVK